MSFVSRGARAAARPLRRSTQQQPRRFAGHGAGHGHGHDAHHGGESALHVAGGSGQESFGKGFYFAIGSVPLSIIIYSLATSSGDNSISRLVRQYDGGREVELAKDRIHITMMEQAAADRQTFTSTPRDTSGPNLRLPESFNFGSPWNVSAGQGSADLTALAKFYEEQNKEAEQERIARLKKNKGSFYD